MPLCEHHPALQWLPTKLAEWIGKNLQDDLGFPDQADPGRVWTPTELNNILDKHIVKKGIDWDILQFLLFDRDNPRYPCMSRIAA